MQEEIIQLKKEKYLIEDDIIWCLSKITVLEDQVGYYKKLRKERLSEEFEKKKFLNNLI